MSGFDLPGVIQLERVADSFPRKYDSAKRYGRNQACRHGEQGVQRVQISCVLGAAGWSFRQDPKEFSSFGWAP